MAREVKDRYTVDPKTAILRSTARARSLKYSSQSARLLAHLNVVFFPNASISTMLVKSDVAPHGESQQRDFPFWGTATDE